MSRRRVAWVAGAAAVALAATAGLASASAPSATGYAAKVLCSAVNISGRDPNDVLAEDLDAFAPFVDTRVDGADGAVEASIFGLAPRRAVFEPARGCTLVIGVPESEIRARSRDVARQRTTSLESHDGHGVDLRALESTLSAAFEEPDQGGPLRTRAIVVLHEGRLLAERYSFGFDADTPLAGWSLTKSLTHALVGIAIHRGQLSRDQRPAVPQWAGDSRAEITLEHLLRMTSGLDFDETHGPLTDATRMLFESEEASAVTVERTPRAEPGALWAYSSGSTNLVQRMLRRSFAGDDASYWAFPSHALFEPLGMSTAVMETDPSGTFVGSSFAYASARDWARFGQLYLQEGVWDKRQVLPAGWAAHAREVTPESHGRYGAHWWTNADPDGEGAPLAGLPEDLFFASGYEGQMVAVIPSLAVVVVRLGQTPDRSDFDRVGLIGGVIASLDRGE